MGINKLHRTYDQNKQHQQHKIRHEKKNTLPYTAQHIHCTAPECHRQQMILLASYMIVALYAMPNVCLSGHMWWPMYDAVDVRETKRIKTIKICSSPGKFTVRFSRKVQGNQWNTKRKRIVRTIPFFLDLVHIRVCAFCMMQRPMSSSSTLCGTFKVQQHRSWVKDAPNRAQDVVLLTCASSDISLYRQFIYACKSRAHRFYAPHTFFSRCYAVDA